MNRRKFLQAGLALGSTAFLNAVPLSTFSTPGGERRDGGSYKPGEKISQEAFVSDKQLNHHKIVDLCQADPEAALNLLYIYGGGALSNSERLGGIWCPDSFEDLYVVRFVHLKYPSEVQIIPVACPPVYSSQYYGLEERVFLDEPADSEKFKKAVQRFIASTEKVVSGRLLPVETYYDFRFRLLFNRREDLLPDKNYGTIYPWQGKFRAEDETQKYGTPTIWLLDRDGVVLTEPFHGNFYHSDPFELSYSAVDVDQAIQQFL
ncbi:MAG: hypothetical protein D6743_18740 [Calditrichaeota bacterium]|nr:MAG: hypothetical protein D6743_18740 [Calditrichota bacterium]